MPINQGSAPVACARRRTANAEATNALIPTLLHEQRRKERVHRSARRPPQRPTPHPPDLSPPSELPPSAVSKPVLRGQKHPAIPGPPYTASHARGCQGLIASHC